MEFPDLGQHCSEPSCKQLDFLPVQCDACKKVFCSMHYMYTRHNCPEAYKKDNQVPVCPLCNAPVPIPRGQLPDAVVGQHIDNDCQSETAQSRRKVFSNKCTLKGCKQKELMPVYCDKCRQNFCLRHRNELDHNCQGFQGSGHGISTAGAAAVSRSSVVAGSSRTTASKSSKTSPQSSSILSSIGAQLNLEREMRNGGTQRITAQQAHSLQQPGMSEDEAMRRAIQMSLQNDSSTPHTTMSSNPPSDRKTQEEMDAALARALQESEMEARGTREPENRQRASSENKSCHIS